MGDVVVEPLTRDHIRAGFNCGRPRIDNFLTNNALTQHDRGQVRVFVTCADDGKTVVGYYSLVCAAYLPLAVGKEPHELFERVRAVPAIYLSMLGVAADHQKAGIGKALVRDAFLRTLHVAGHVGVYMLCLDAATDELVPFYDKLGFQPFDEGERRMYIPIETIRLSIAA